MIQAVLFDLDGTLLDRDSSVQLFLERQYDRLHAWLHPIPKDTYCKRFIELEKRGYVWKDVVYRQLAEEFQLEGCTPEMLLQDYRDHYGKSSTAFCGLFPMLRTLRHYGIKLGLVTNGLEDIQRSAIRGIGIETYFDTILISETEGIAKPDQAIFQRALSTLNVDPEKTIFVGDHPVNDIEAASTAGMKTIWKRHPFDEMPESTWQIDHLEEIPTLLLKYQFQSQL